ncbi:hypothetical protein E3Z27_25485 [Pseudomonas mediterranea]|uniref:SPOR domain-containing protein n=1 Tax=Pseudomonas mediterranea TaxID=183795 RepID=A0AAX2D7X2_9PSED|nr:hypothetical protein [Pseudomonas mediterranea]KGU84130.1 hypothetical protein N005_20275 [Pseudomonas mediterranea CFBP 5447]MBL0845503.1 hypothetical protein [Pseudomonas mediterranea]QHA84765.1 hypothetical protein E3Z27_25485 [Pseudomonas mediterranea]UZE00490.1 hypothetical protein LOY71_23805 [Pseudomonas mediterranea]SDU26974.1 hypothetical protein SAMN05216476_1206 [Pseudomonas mediterranea]
MRWLFLLLLVLNAFYYVWHQQEAPLRAKDVTPLSLYRGSQQDIHLLSETADALVRRDSGKPGEAQKTCIHLGGFARSEINRQLEQKLAALGVVSRATAAGSLETGFWVQVSPESAGKVNETFIQNLSKEFNELKHKIMPCEGVAPAG